MIDEVKHAFPRGPLERTVDWVFGYDFFVSYSHDDGFRLPRQLAALLKEAGFRVFLDQTEYFAGIDLGRETRRQVRNSRKIVILGRPSALKSKWVLREAETALESGKIPIIIDVNDAVELAPPDAKLARLAKDKDWLRLKVSIYEPDGQLPGHVVSELVRGFGHMRQNQKRQRVFFGAAVVLAMTTVGATWQAVEARRQRDIAQANFETAKATADGLVVEIARGLRDVEGLQAESVRKILTRAQQAYDQLADSVDDDNALLLSRAIMQNEFVETYLAQGDTEAAQAAAEKGVALAKLLANQGDLDQDAQRQLALSFVKLGDAMQEVGDYELAGTAYQRALEIRQALADTDRTNDWAARDVAIVLARQAEIAEHHRDYAQMSKLLANSLEIREPLVKRNPAWRRDLVVANIMLGDAYLGLGQSSRAGAAFERSVDIAQALHTEDPTSTRFTRFSAIALQRRGNYALVTGSNVQAQADYTSSKSLFEGLASKDPGNIEWQRDVVVSIGKLAKTAEVMGDVVSARHLFSEAVARRRELLGKSPDNALLKMDLVEALKDFGAHLDKPAAIEILEEARGFLKELSSLNQLTAEQNNWLADIEAALGNPEH